MTRSLQQALNPEKALIFRVTHRLNVPWLLQHGLHANSSAVKDPDFVSIGSPDLIAKRRSRSVSVPPFGTLDDYVPFYFTPHSPMLYNIRTGRGVPKRPNEEIVILVSDLHQVVVHEVPFVLTDRHAYLEAACFFESLGDLPRVDFELLRRRDFQRDPNDPEKIERYQAEALLYQYLPAGALRGIGCYTPGIESEIAREVASSGHQLQVVSRPGWYF